MASRYGIGNSKSLHVDLWNLPGIIAITSGAAVDATNTVFKGASVAKTGTGQYTVTFLHSDGTPLAWPSLLDCQLTYEVAGTSATSVKLVSASSATLVIAVITSSTGAPVDPVAACKIHVRVTLKNSAVA